jgi:hypothetical protein
MKSGKCPSCDSANVYHRINGIYVPNTLGTFINTANGNMGSQTDDHICTDCGYMERYVADEQKLKDIAEVWDKVG